MATQQHRPKALTHSPVGEGDSSSNPTYGTICAPAHVNKPLGSHSSIVANFPLLDTIAPGCGPLQRTFLPSGISLSEQDLWWSFGKDLWITGFHSIAKRVFQENLPLTSNTALQIYLFWWNRHSPMLPGYCPWTRCYCKASVDHMALNGPAVSQIAVWPWGSCLTSLNKRSHL